MKKIVIGVIVVAVIGGLVWLVSRKPPAAAPQAAATSASAPAVAGPGTPVSMLWRNQGTGENRAWRFVGAEAPAAETLWSAASPWVALAYSPGGWSGSDLAAWKNSETGEIKLWKLLPGNAEPIVKSLPPAGKDWQAIAFADVNGDGEADVIWHDPAGQVAVWLLRDGTVKQQGVVSSTGAGWNLVAFGDLNNDGKQDLVWHNKVDSILGMWLMDGVVLKSSTSKPDGGADWRLAGVGNFDSDRGGDLLWAGKDGQLIAWQSGDSTKPIRLSRQAPADWQLVDLLDLEGDGFTDLIWLKPETGQVAGWKFNEGGEIADLSLPSVAQGWSLVAGIAPVSPVN